MLPQTDTLVLSRERHRLYMLEWRQRNHDRQLLVEARRRELRREHLREYSKKHYQENHDHRRETMNAARRQHRVDFPEQHLAYNQKYHLEHREHILVYEKQWYEDHKDTWVKEYRETHRSEKLAYDASRRTKIKGHHVDISYIIERDGMTCGICGKPVRREELSFDHIVPLARGGQHTDDNVQVSHLICNIRKGARWPVAQTVSPASSVQL